uniref:Large ribosomal subunit protein uL13c n=1 Tax=Actinocyclus subtilis TaxID=1630683 RepID=A0A2U9NQA7_9STRA|nr:ribosomal protein L13 [Actinocyclus subtilis]AWT39309.1 ribosomal protein L13 [Actinocyclus subtilis]
MNNTFLSNSNYSTKKWYIIDATNKSVGRLSTLISTILQGKHKVDYNPSINVGDYIIIINAEKIIFDASKIKYHVYKPGKPGSALKKVTNRSPQKVIEDTVKNMLPKGLRSLIPKRLRIYNSSNHPHLAQNPVVFNLEK